MKGFKFKKVNQLRIRFLSWFARKTGIYYPLHRVLNQTGDLVAKDPIESLEEMAPDVVFFEQKDPVNIFGEKWGDFAPEKDSEKVHVFTDPGVTQTMLSVPVGTAKSPEGTVVIQGNPRVIYLKGSNMEFGVIEKSFTQKEWSDLTADDEVVKLWLKVNERALSGPHWPSNYAIAIYEAFGQEYCEYVKNKYNQGKPFFVMGAQVK